MAKKKDQAVTEAENQEAQRRQAIAEYNMNNMGKYWIDADKIPTDEDINNAKTEYENYTKELQEKKDYMVADKENSKRVAQFLREFVSHSFWTQRSFVGVLNFTALLDDFLKDFKDDEPVDLVMEYPPLQFCYLVLENYAGFGVEDAEKMAKMWDEYLPIYEHVKDLIDDFNIKNSRSNDLKERWNMMAHGYYMTIMEASGEEAEPETPVESEENVDETPETQA